MIGNRSLFSPGREVTMIGPNLITFSPSCGIIQEKSLEAGLLGLWWETLCYVGFASPILGMSMQIPNCIGRLFTSLGPGGIADYHTIKVMLLPPGQCLLFYYNMYSAECMSWSCVV